jgi:hypothetical protein
MERELQIKLRLIFAIYVLLGAALALLVAAFIMKLYEALH